ncbi:MAG: hypothetical protein KFH87_05170 [Bacteroidetes bacterium]|nr:hypothetical protein [Bacteroidota bacterium]
MYYGSRTPAFPPMLFTDRREDDRFRSPVQCLRWGRKRSLLFAIVLSFTVPLLCWTAVPCVGQTAVYSDDWLIGEYRDLFELRRGEREYAGELVPTIIRRLRPIPSSHPLYVLIQRHPRVIDYLLQHASPAMNAVFREETADSVSLYAALEGDASFHALLHPLVARFFEGEGTPHECSTSVRRTLSPDSLLRIAVRFIYPRWRKDGTVRYYKCIGINGWNGSREPRDLVAEAFSYASLFPDSTHAMHHQALDREVTTELHALLLATEGEEEEKRAVLWNALTRNSHLEVLLQAGYEEMRIILPFVVPEWEEKGAAEF